MGINSTEKLSVRNNDNVDYEKDLPNEEQAIKNAKLHKRLDDLLEEKRLKEMLDDTDDWDI